MFAVHFWQEKAVHCIFNWFMASGVGTMMAMHCRLEDDSHLRQVIYFPSAAGTSLAVYRALRHTSCWDCADSNELSHATGGHSYRSHDAHNRHVARTKGGSAAFTFVLAGCQSPRMSGALLATIHSPSVGTARLSIRVDTCHCRSSCVLVVRNRSPAARTVHYKNWASH